MRCAIGLPWSQWPGAKRMPGYRPACFGRYRFAVTQYLGKLSNATFSMV